LTFCSWLAFLPHIPDVYEYERFKACLLYHVRIIQDPVSGQRRKAWLAGASAKPSFPRGAARHNNIGCFTSWARRRLLREVFRYLQPQAVVISDKSIIHDTQEMVPDYRAKVRGDGILTTNEQGRRQVLTTRCDGDILFRVEPNGNYTVTTHAT
jgi:hypothetical protein